MNMKKIKSNEIAKNALILFLIAFIVSGLTVTVFYSTNQKVYEIKEISAVFKVGNVTGFALDQDVLNFGIAPYGASSIKEIVISHNYATTLRVEISYKGDIAPVLSKIKPFDLEPNTERKIIITAYAGNETASYMGTVVVRFIKK